MTTTIIIFAVLIAALVGYYVRGLLLAKRMPFFRDVQRLIAENPEYAEGIERGIVHLHFDPGYREGIRAKRKPAPAGGSRSDGPMFQPATGNAPDM